MGFPRDFPRESHREGIAGREGGKPLACHSIPTTFPREIPRKTHTFPTLVNKNNILYSIGVVLTALYFSYSPQGKNENFHTLLRERMKISILSPGKELKFSYYPQGEYKNFYTLPRESMIFTVCLHDVYSMVSSCLHVYMLFTVCLHDIYNMFT